MRRYTVLNLDTVKAYFGTSVDAGCRLQLSDVIFWIYQIAFISLVILSSL